MLFWLTLRIINEWFFPTGSEVSQGGSRSHGRLNGTQFLKEESPPAKDKTHSWVHSLDCELTHCVSWANSHLRALVWVLSSSVPVQRMYEADWIAHMGNFIKTQAYIPLCVFNWLVWCFGQLHRRATILLESLLRNRLLFWRKDLTGFLAWWDTVMTVEKWIEKLEAVWGFFTVKALE